MMKKYKVKSGLHLEGGIKYKGGDTFTSERDLCSMFVNKFDCLGPVAQPAPEPETEDPETEDPETEDPETEAEDPEPEVEAEELPPTKPVAKKKAVKKKAAKKKDNWE